MHTPLSDPLYRWRALGLQHDSGWSHLSDGNLDAVAPEKGQGEKMGIYGQTLYGGGVTDRVGALDRIADRAVDELFGSDDEFGGLFEDEATESESEYGRGRAPAPVRAARAVHHGRVMARRGDPGVHASMYGPFYAPAYELGGYVEYPEEIPVEEEGELEYEEELMAGSDSDEYGRRGGGGGGGFRPRRAAKRVVKHARKAARRSRRAAAAAEAFAPAPAYAPVADPWTGAEEPLPEETEEEGSGEEEGEEEEYGGALRRRTYSGVNELVRPRYGQVRPRYGQQSLSKYGDTAIIVPTRSSYRYDQFTDALTTGFGVGLGVWGSLFLLSTLVRGMSAK